jgi:hypothetical protein
MKMEQVKVSYAHEMDSMKEKRKEIPRGVSVTPNSGLRQAVDEVGNPNRLQCQYVVGKSPKQKEVTPATIEGMRHG